MNKKLIPATFGGVLASGFLMLSAPVASAAGPCVGDATSPGGTGMGSQVCSDCFHANANNDPAQVCFLGTGAEQPAAPNPPQPPEGCNSAIVNAACIVGNGIGAPLPPACSQSLCAPPPPRPGPCENNEVPGCEGTIGVRG